MIKKLVKTIKKVFIPKSEFVEEPKKVEKLQPSYVGMVAPVVPPSDHWFGSPVKSEKVIAYEKQVAQEIEKQKIIEASQPKPKEPENIHEVMYKTAVKSWGSWQESLGGSENFQEGPGGWDSGAGFQSGTGYNQFRG